MSVDANCGRHDYTLPTLSETRKQIQRGLVANSWGGIDPETIRRVSQVTDAAERLVALNNLVGPRPSKPAEESYNFAISSRQEQLDQFAAQYFEDTGFDVVYRDLGKGRYGSFKRAGQEYLGEIFERDTLVIGESAFEEGWETVGVTIFHEWLEQYRDVEFTHEEIIQLENLWREWYRQNR